MTWMRLDSTVREHRKVSRLARDLGLSRPHALGHLVCLWTWALDNAPDGDLDDLTSEELAEAAQWGGDPEAFRLTLVTRGLLDETEHGLQIHDWREHAEGLRAAERTAKWREARRLAPKPAPKPDEPVRHGDIRVRNSDIRVRHGDVRRDGTGRDGTGRERDVVSPAGETAAPVAASSPRATEIRDVFAHYRTLHPRSFAGPQPESAEWKAIARRLSEGFTVRDLCDAIDGCHATPHNLGENDRHTKYLGLDLIVRSGSQVTRFAETARSGAGRPGGAGTPKRRDPRTIEPNDWTHATRPEPTKPPEHLQRGLALAEKAAP